MKPLFPPLRDESLLSWVNRFALFHCGVSAEEFCRVIGLPQQELIIGRQHAFSKLAVVFGVPVEQLRARSHYPVSSRVYGYRSENFFQEFLLRNRQTFCPACLLSDIETNRDGLRVGAARINWTFSPVRTCRYHNVPLVRARKATSNGSKIDTSYLKPDIPKLEDILAHSKTRRPSELQGYVEKRLDGHKVSSWMDSQPIDLASRSTEMLGACLEFGAHAALSKLNEDNWDQAAKVGYEFTSKGEEGIREALRYLLSNSERSQSQSGPQGTFGGLFHWAQADRGVKHIGPFKEVFREFILDNVRVEPGTLLFGSVVDQARVHSVASLARKYALHPKTVRSALTKSGLLRGSNDHDSMRQTARVQQSEKLIKKLVRAVPVSKIPDYIECTRAQAQHLLKAGILKPVVDDEKKFSGRHKGVDSDDLDRLLKQMRQNGKPVVNAGLGMANVGDAANALHVPTTDIVSLLLKGGLENVELLPELFKFRSVLVDLTEVSFKLGMQDGKTGVTISDSARELGVHLDVVRFLLSANADSGCRALESCGRYRHMGKMCDLVDPRSLDKFKSRFRKLSQIEGYWVRDPERLRSKLAERGIRPAWDPAIAGAEFYRVSDL
ncbi:TniQ family protein [Ruegeria sp. HKCCA0370]|uniref:TniQ family protein n=1 Tax=Ruegeria sp. HKCCA0370 TaxID=2682995 RepID=UPI001487B709|nr:TniQ family protein [Ruegeria sp. HKCCA0370]